MKIIDGRPRRLNILRADFFEVAAFQGGTSLRLLHGGAAFRSISTSS